jgi:hypothetical protein
VQEKLLNWLRGFLPSADWNWGAIWLVTFALAMAPILRFEDGIFLSPLSLFARVLAADVFAPFRASLANLATDVQPQTVTLAKFDPKQDNIELVTFTRPDPLPVKDRGFDIWATTKHALRLACAGADRPVRRLQQVLGLPPSGNENYVVTEFSVPSAGVFRPCISNTGLSQDACAAQFPAEPPDNADPKALRDAYKRLSFVAEQLWKKTRPGFNAAPPAPGAPPASAYPFTGMGWTYDWSPDSPNHVGVTEFIVRRDAMITPGKSTPAAAFCGPSTGTDAS